jgi:hypothetical protein
VEEGIRENQRRDMGGKYGSIWLALKMQEEATSQGMQVTFRSWKGSPRTSRRNTIGPLLILTQSDPFWTSGLRNFWFSKKNDKSIFCLFVVSHTG